jgi:hypothetical protein
LTTVPIASTSIGHSPIAVNKQCMQIWDVHEVDGTSNITIRSFSCKKLPVVKDPPFHHNWYASMICTCMAQNFITYGWWVEQANAYKECCCCTSPASNNIGAFLANVLDVSTQWNFSIRTLQTQLGPCGPFKGTIVGSQMTPQPCVWPKFAFLSHFHPLRIQCWAGTRLKPLYIDGLHIKELTRLMWPNANTDLVPISTFSFFFVFASSESLDRWKQSRDKPKTKLKFDNLTNKFI